MFTGLTILTLAFKLLKPQSYGWHTPELKSISKFQLLFHWRNFEKYMIFYTLPWSRWNRPHKLWNTGVYCLRKNVKISKSSYPCMTRKLCATYIKAVLHHCTLVMLKRCYDTTTRNTSGNRLVACCCMALQKLVV